MNPTIDTSIHLNELLKKFNDSWNIKMKNSSSFITLSEVEDLLDNLKINTNKLYLKMVNEYIKNIDEKELISKKKQNTKLKEFNLEIQKEGIKKS